MEGSRESRLGKKPEVPSCVEPAVLFSHAASCKRSGLRALAHRLRSCKIPPRKKRKTKAGALSRPPGTSLTSDDVYWYLIQ